MSCKNYSLSIVLAGLLAGCGGGSPSSDDDDSGNNPPPPPPAAETATGVFVDSAVGGIGYRTDTQEGETTAAGEFDYVDGESVTFFIGDVELPAVTGAGLVTPLDVFETQDFSDQRVINLARLLQSLDTDGDPDNGITLGDAAHQAATGLTLDFNVPTETFEANTGVINLVSNGGGAGTLVSAADALAHLQQLSLVGSWHVGDESEYLAVTFLADGRYVIAEGEPADEAGSPGLEFGTYTWHPLTGEITVNVELDTNGEWGLSHAQPDLKFHRSGNTVDVTETVDGVLETTTFVRAVDAENPLIGGWVRDNEGSLNVLVLTATHYALADIVPEVAGETPPGPEFGTYTWDPVSGAFNPVADPAADLNADGGFSHEAVAITMAVEGDAMELTYGGTDVVTLERVK